MKTLYMIKGLPASGKTTAAKARVAMQPGTKRVNKDDLRAMLDAGKWTEANERVILNLRNDLVTDLLDQGFHVIVDDTNLAPKHEPVLRQLAKNHKAHFEILDFTHVSPEECIKRDLARPNSVGQTVILDMWERYLRPQAQVPPPYDFMLDDAILVDVDGTVAEMYNRTPYEWTKVHQDRPRRIVVDVIKKQFWDTDAKLVFISGRDSVCRDLTQEWLYGHFSVDFQLFMRPAGDMRRDSIVKREIYEREIKGKYNVLAIFDDRPQVIRECWQELGFGDRIFNVGTGREF